MSTTAQRAMERLARAINQAFSGATMFVRDADFAQYGGGTNEPVPVKAEALGVKSGGVAGTGIRLTIGNRTVTFDENGQLVGVEGLKATKPDTRTVAEVLEQRKHAVMGGCCNRFADQMGCDCLEKAKAREARPEFVNPPPPAQTRPGDFSKVDWGRSGMTYDSTKVGLTYDGTSDEFKCSE